MEFKAIEEVIKGIESEIQARKVVKNTTRLAMKEVRRTSKKIKGKLDGKRC